MKRVLSARAISGLALVIAGSITLLTLTFNGALSTPLLEDPGLPVRALTPFFKAMLQLSVAVTLGTLIYAIYALPQESWLQVRRFAAGWAATWTLFAIIHLLLNYLRVSVASLDFSQQFGAGLWFYVTQIESGRWLAFNLLLAAILTQWLLLTSSKFASLGSVLLALLGAYPLAELGHSAAAGGHALAVGALLLHVLGISLWLGGLASTIWGLRRWRNLESELVGRFSTMALLGFVLVGASGLASATLRLTGLSELLTPYGLLLASKVALFIILGGIGASYRRRLAAGRAGALTAPTRLLVMECVLLASTIGLGSALAATPTPSGELPPVSPTPAEILTGNPLPPELTPLTWITQWRIDPIWLAVALGLAFFYLSGVRRMSLRGDHWSPGRTLSWLAGLAVLGFVTNGAPAAYGEYLFSAHMIGHMLLSMLVPILLVLGAPITLLSRTVIVRVDGSLSPRDWIQFLLHSRVASLIFTPVFAAANFAVSLVLFYFTPLFRWANEEHIGHQWMLIHFLLSGYLFAQVLVGVDPNSRPLSYPFRIILLIATMAFHAFFGLALMNQSGLLLADWYGSMGRTWGLDPLADQQAGGAIAWGIGEIPTIVLTLIAVTQWARSDERERRRLDRAAERSGDDELANYNRMLKQLAQRDGQTRN